MDDDDNSAMQEMMGFSSFGSHKRKKLNSGAVSSIPSKPPTTASNSTPLGNRTSTIKSPLSMIPASLPPSGRASASPPPTAKQNVAKVPNQGMEGQNRTDSKSDLTKDSQATPDASPYIQKPSESSRNSFNASAETFLPSRPAPTRHTDQVSPSAPLSTAKPTYSANDVRSDPSYWAPAQNRPSVAYRKGNAAPNANSNDDDIAYTSPWTGATMTRKQLREYGCGKQETQEDGSVATVFFKPGFLASSEDLWGRWLGPTKRKGKEDDMMGARDGGVASEYVR